ncbi:MAG TPA: ATP-binding protein [Verrucomicrobiae bacterium]
MEELVLRVVQDLKTGLTCPNCKIEVGRLPTISANGPLIYQVWTNLLSNALKYSSSKPAPHVVVTAQSGISEVCFEVVDNGIGFNLAESDKLFSDYGRLKNADGIDGCGLGLSVVKRIVESHGGRVWALGELGLGSTFGFSLPVKSVAVDFPHHPENIAHEAIEHQSKNSRG